jgi:hypothetical protein
MEVSVMGATCAKPKTRVQQQVPLLALHCLDDLRPLLVTQETASLAERLGGTDAITLEEHCWCHHALDMRHEIIDIIYSDKKLLLIILDRYF